MLFKTQTVNASLLHWRFFCKVCGKIAENYVFVKITGGTKICINLPHRKTADFQG